MNKKVRYYSFGCKVNLVETDNIRSKMEKSGFETAEQTVQSGHESESDADIHIINSCTVTEQADKKTFKLVRRIRNENPSAVIVLTGCYPSAHSQNSPIFSLCDIVTGARDKNIIPELVERFSENKEKISCVTPHAKNDLIEPMDFCDSDLKTRAYIKIQDGCNRFCSYCIIPFARGRSRSISLEDLRRQSEKIAAAGYKEVVLTGVNLCCFGEDLPQKASLADAVEIVCAQEGVERVRLSSLEPEMISDEDIRRMAACKKLCPHFHLSLQSGCDKTLKAMNRRYDTKEYAGLVRKLRAAFENCAVTTDIMVGFAGETEEDFEQSLKFAEEIGFAQAHVFAYSPRENTKAAKSEEQVSAEEKARRSREMRELCGRLKKKFEESMTGKTEEVLFERDEGEEFHEGYTRNYIRVRVKKSGEESWRNEIKKIKLTGADGGIMTGEEI